MLSGENILDFPETFHQVTAAAINLKGSPPLCSRLCYFLASQISWRPKSRRSKRRYSDFLNWGRQAANFGIGSRRKGVGSAAGRGSVSLSHITLFRCL